MCETNICEWNCSHEQREKCPVIWIISNLQVPVQDTTNKVSSAIPTILQWPAEWSASNFFATWWTWNR